MAKNDDQQKLISFRVEDGFYQRFEALKERFSVGGRKVTTSDLARSLLEAAHAQHGEFGELLGNQVQSIKDIHELAKTGQPLRKSQWEFISYLVHRAYQLNQRQMVQGRYFRSALQAFAAWRRMMGPEDGEIPTDAYFLSNLRRTDASSLLDRVQALIDEMPALVWTSQAEFGTRNLNVAMRDGIQAINALELHDALAPYLTDLLPVAIRAVYMDTKQPLYEAEVNYFEPPIRPVQSEHFCLDVMTSGTSISAALTFRAHRSIHPLNNFVQFQELAQLLEEVTPENASTKSDTYWLAGPPLTAGENYYLRFRGHQMELTSAEFTELRQLIRQAKEQPDFQALLARMATVFGDI